MLPTISNRKACNAISLCDLFTLQHKAFSGAVIDYTIVGASSRLNLRYSPEMRCTLKPRILIHLFSESLPNKFHASPTNLQSTVPEESTNRAAPPPRIRTILATTPRRWWYDFGPSPLQTSDIATSIVRRLGCGLRDLGGGVMSHEPSKCLRRGGVMQAPRHLLESLWRLRPTVKQLQQILQPFRRPRRAR